MNILADISKSIRTPQIWLEMGLQDFMDQYSRTYLGITWAVLQPALWILAISVFFQPLVSSEQSFYVAYVAIGVTVYNFITASLTDCGVAFIKRGALIQNFALPLFSYVLRDTTKVTIRFGLQALIVVAVFAYYGLGLPENLWLLVPAIALLLIACLAMSLLTSIATAWSGDLQHAIASLMRLLFFATPIIWLLPKEPGLRNYLAQLNPFTHYIEIVRAPLLNQDIPVQSWTFALGFTAIAIIIAFIASRSFGQKIAFWVAT